MGQALFCHWGYNSKHNTQKPQVHSLSWAFTTLFLLPGMLSPDNLLVSLSYFIFLQRTYYLLTYHFSYFFFHFSIFVSSYLSSLSLTLCLCGFLFLSFLLSTFLFCSSHPSSLPLCKSVCPSIYIPPLECRLHKS